MRIPHAGTRRRGVTLVECLVAIFVASIGLLALLALFPVGALAMRQALKDSRCAQLSANATALYLGRVGQDPGVLTSLQTATSTYNTANYPIYVDPIGMQTASSTLAGSSTYPIPRTGVYFIPVTSTNYASLCVRWFTLLDDITFPQDDSTGFSTTSYAGLPCTPGSVYTRDPRYSFAYMVRLPNPSLLIAGNVTVVVYSGRPIPPPASLPGEYAYALSNSTTYTGTGGTYAATQNTITISSTSQPNVKPGGWVLDATMSDTSNGPHGYFYRVTDVVNNGDGTYTLQLQTNLRVAITPSGNAGQIMVLDNVVEVFEKGLLYTP